MDLVVDLAFLDKAKEFDLMIQDHLEDWEEANLEEVVEWWVQVDTEAQVVVNSCDQKFESDPRNIHTSHTVNYVIYL